MKTLKLRKNIGLHFFLIIRHHKLLLSFLSWGTLICEQRFKRLNRGKLIQYFRHNETFLLSLYFSAVLICGYSPSPQRSPGNPKSVSLWSDTWTQTFLPINYISCVIKQNWLPWSPEECFRHKLATFQFVGPIHPDSEDLCGPRWSGKRSAELAHWTEQCWNVFSLSIHLNNVPFCTS